MVYSEHHMYCNNTVWGDTQNYDNNGAVESNIISNNSGAAATCDEMNVSV